MLVAQGIEPIAQHAPQVAVGHLCVGCPRGDSERLPCRRIDDDDRALAALVHRGAGDERVDDRRRGRRQPRLQGTLERIEGCGVTDDGLEQLQRPAIGTRCPEAERVGVQAGGERLFRGGDGRRGKRRRDPANEDRRRIGRRGHPRRQALVVADAERRTRRDVFVVVDNDDVAGLSEERRGAADPWHLRDVDQHHDVERTVDVGGALDTTGAVDGATRRRQGIVDDGNGVLADGTQRGHQPGGAGDTVAVGRHVPDDQHAPGVAQDVDDGVGDWDARPRQRRHRRIGDRLAQRRQPTLRQGGQRGLRRRRRRHRRRADGTGCAIEGVGGDDRLRHRRCTGDAHDADPAGHGGRSRRRRGRRRRGR